MKKHVLSLIVSQVLTATRHDIVITSVTSWLPA